MEAVIFQDAPSWQLNSDFLASDPQMFRGPMYLLTLLPKKYSQD